ncbi:hypothetical protein BHE74_00053455 [Ensete ventricosum]|nr:hypothetical protein BHE74_00053455 [Ensete ventricosum]
MVPLRSCDGTSSQLRWYLFAAAMLPLRCYDAPAAAASVDWENEKECFQAISAVLGNFYAMHPPVLPNPAGNGIEFYKKLKDKAASIDDAGNELTGTDDHGQDDLDQELLAEAETAWAQREWNIQHVASLEKLYKIFERC